MSTLKEICKDQRELLNECRQNIKELTEENKKLKEQIDTSQVSRLIAENEQLKEEKDKLEQENKEHNEIIYKLHKSYNETIDTLCESYNSLGERSKSLEHENKALRLQSNTYFDEWQEAEKQRDQYKAECERLERQNAEQLALLKEFRKLIDYKLTLHQGSSMYREYRSKLDQLGVK